MITIFTPTYNRSYLLPDVYKSLCNQSFTDFEWIIVDDGSSDNTKEIVAQFINDKKIKISYIWQANRGKHFAINRGVSEANGELFFILDSDDKLPADSLENVYSYFQKIKDNPKIGGVAGRRNYDDGKIVGTGDFKELIANSIDIRYKYNVTGDLVEVFKTQVLKEFPFPEIENEKFCPEALLWNRISEKYTLLFFNEGIYTTQYLPDGLTAKIVKIRMTSPIASMLTYSELEKKEISLLQKIKANINFWRFSFNSNYSFSKKMAQVGAFFSLFGFPIGYAMYLKDKKNNR